MHYDDVGMVPVAGLPTRTPLQEIVYEITEPLRGAVTSAPWYADGGQVVAETPPADTGADGYAIAALPSITRRLVDAAWVTHPITHPVQDVMRVGHLQRVLARVESHTTLAWDYAPDGCAWMALSPAMEVVAPSAPDIHDASVFGQGAHPVAVVRSPVAGFARDVAEMLSLAWTTHDWLVRRLCSAVAHLDRLDEVRTAQALLPTPTTIDVTLDDFDIPGWLCHACGETGTGSPIATLREAQSHWCGEAL